MFRAGNAVALLLVVTGCSLCSHHADYMYRDIYVQVRTDSGRPTEAEFIAATECFLARMDAELPGASRTLKYMWVRFVDSPIQCGTVAHANGCFRGDSIDVRWIPPGLFTTGLFTTAWPHEMGHAMHYRVDGTSDGQHRDMHFWQRLHEIQLECEVIQLEREDMLTEH